MKVTELQGSLDAHEQRMNDRNVERNSSQVLQVSSIQEGRIKQVERQEVERKRKYVQR